MFDEFVASRVGQVIHRVIASAVRDDLDVGDTTELLDRLWAEAPIGGTTAWQTRTRAHLAVSTYLRRLRPQGWVLLGDEVRLGSAIADLVWARLDDGEPRVVFIDEVKTGRRPLDAPELADQVARLHSGGNARWGTAFAGVRVAETSHASRTGFWVSDGTTLTAAAGPALDVDGAR